MFPTVEASREARRELTALAGRIDRASLADVASVVSELVAISVAHGASKLIEVVLTVEDGKLLGTLCDDGAGPRAVVRARKRRSDSLVLRIVDALVEEWGTDASESRIWFRMAVQPI